MAHVRTSSTHRPARARERGHANQDAFLVIGLLAVIIGAATGSLAIALAVFAAPALALGGAIFLRSHL